MENLISKSPTPFLVSMTTQTILLKLLCTILWVFLMGLAVKNLPAMQETWVLTLGGEGPLEKGMAVHSSILVWKILWTEETSRL